MKLGRRACTQKCATYLRVTASAKAGGTQAWQSLLMNRQYFVYIMTNDTNTVTYTGVTNDLIRRVYEHRNKLVKGFTSKYNINKLVYFDVGENIESCILREKQIKSWSRKDKVALVEKMNPDWNDLSKELM
jgi:putative endonuclease